MKNPSFIKLICILCALGLVGLGYRLLPGRDDIRQQAFEQSISSFTQDFHAVERPKKKEKLPSMSVLSREGRPVELAEISRGRITVVNFWATWCAPCLEEMPSLARLQEMNADIMVLPISLDMQKPLAEIGRFFEKDELRDLRWFYDSDGVLRKHLALKVYPATYILDKEGYIIYKLEGPTDWSSTKALNFIRALSNKY